MTPLLDSLARVAPVIAFLLAITVVAELSDRAGVFDVAGHWLARHGGRRMLRLWFLFSGLAIACTIVLSLDTTAVLLTPVALAIARQIGAAPRPFALTTLWIANTGSLLLPVSNLTNLLALHRFETMGVDHAATCGSPPRPRAPRSSRRCSSSPRCTGRPWPGGMSSIRRPTRTTRSCCGSPGRSACSSGRPSPRGSRHGPSPAWRPSCSASPRRCGRPRRCEDSRSPGPWPRASRR